MSRTPCPYRLPRYRYQNEARNAIPDNHRNRWAVWHCGDSWGQDRHWHAAPNIPTLEAQ